MKQLNNLFCRSVSVSFASLILTMLFVCAAQAQTTAFTYQGRLTDTATSGSATYDMQFDLYDTDVDGTLIGTITNSAVFVSNGVFTVSLNYGSAAFNGSERYLAISVRPAGSNAPRTPLNPRQRITSVPYATQSLKATTATNFTANLGGDVTGTQTATVVSTVGGTSAANVAAGAGIANAATSANTASTVVRRDASGDFGAGTITAGNVTLTTGGKVTFADGTSQSTSVDPSLFVVRNTQSGSVRVENDRLTVQPTSATNEFALFRVISPANNLTSLSGIMAQFRSNAGGSSVLTDKFRIDQAGGFVAIGEIGYGIIPASGCGYRTMWHPFKAAFRSGSTNDGGACAYWDDANVGFFSVAMGDRVTAASQGATAFGGSNNISNNASYGFSVGNSNDTLDIYGATIGFDNLSNGDAAMAFGYKSIAGGNYSVALGAYASTCDSVGGTAGSGAFCQTPRKGSFSFGDNSTTTYLTTTADNQFNARAAGGYRLYTNALMTTGVGLSAGGGAWATISDRNAKENFGAVNSRDVLRSVLKLPISTWSYKGQTYRHIGAMAQDFYQAFGVGENDTTITTVDPDGVAFAAIQGLNAEMTERTAKLQAENERLRRELAAQQTRFDRLEQRLEKLERRAPRRAKGRK